MLNSVSESPTAPRRRLSAEERRRQLIGIGLAKIVDTPIQDLAMDEIAAEAGISRGLLFHYFATKTDFYLACIQAAGRRILRNTSAPDDVVEPAARVAAVVRALVEQIERRREFYLALVHGHGIGDARVGEVMGSVRRELTTRVLDDLGLDPERGAVVHAWWAYVEDRALTWSDPAADGRRVRVDQLVQECTRALDALLVSASPSSC